uniref:Uncharacterized protein n=1 Tax=Arundo donax TaxID=35708 RepID=A0A0A8XRN8_ARUDO
MSPAAAPRQHRPPRRRRTARPTRRRQRPRPTPIAPSPAQATGPPLPWHWQWSSPWRCSSRVPFPGDRTHRYVINYFALMRVGRPF